MGVTVGLAAAAVGVLVGVALRVALRLGLAVKLAVIVGLVLSVLVVVAVLVSVWLGPVVKLSVIVGLALSVFVAVAVLVSVRLGLAVKLSVAVLVGGGVYWAVRVRLGVGRAAGKKLLDFGSRGLLRSGPFNQRGKANSMEARGNKIPSASNWIPRMFLFFRAMVFLAHKGKFTNAKILTQGTLRQERRMPSSHFQSIVSKSRTNSTLRNLSLFP